MRMAGTPDDDPADEEKRVAPRGIRGPAARAPLSRRAEGPAAPTRSKSAADEVLRTAAPNHGHGDHDVARQNGMDPLGVALQRSLARQSTRVKAS